MSERKTTPERLAAFSDAVFAVIITIMVLDRRPPERVYAALISRPVVPGSQLRRKLSVYRHNLGKPSLSVSIRAQRDVGTHLVELRPSFHDCAGACSDRLDGSLETGCRSGLRICACLCSDRDRLHCVRASRVFASERQQTFSSGSTGRKNALISGFCHIRRRDRDLLVVAPEWVGSRLLRLAHLPQRAVA